MQVAQAGEHLAQLLGVGAVAVGDREADLLLDRALGAVAKVVAWQE